MSEQPKAKSRITLDAELASYGPRTVSMRLCDALLKAVPQGPELVEWSSLDSCVEHADLAPEVAARANELANEDGVGRALFAARSIDTGDTGITILTGVRSALSLFMGDKGPGAGANSQQRADAALKALGIAYLATQLIPREAATRVVALEQIEAGRALMLYYAAVEVALPFGDEAIAANGTFVADLVEQQSRKIASKLLGVIGRQGVDDAQETLALLTSRLDRTVLEVAPHATTLAESVRAVLPSILGAHTGAMQDVVAAGADALPIYRFLTARLAAESTVELARWEADPSLEPQPEPEPEPEPEMDPDAAVDPDAEGDPQAAVDPQAEVGPDGGGQAVAEDGTADSGAADSGAADSGAADGGNADTGVTPVPAETATPPTMPGPPPMVPMGLASMSLGIAGLSPQAVMAEPAASAPKPQEPPVVEENPEPEEAPVVEEVPEAQAEHDLGGVYQASTPAGGALWLVFTRDGVFSNHPPASPDADWVAHADAGHQVGTYQHRDDQLTIRWPSGDQTTSTFAREPTALQMDGRRCGRCDWNLAGHAFAGTWTARVGDGRFALTADGSFDSDRGAGTYKLGVGAVEFVFANGMHETRTLYSTLEPDSGAPDTMWIGGLAYDRT